MTLKRRAARLLPLGLRRRLMAHHYLRLYRTMPAEQVPDLARVRAFIRPGDLVVDVGANIGVYTRHFAEWVGPEGRVVSIEPGPLAYSLLEQNLRRTHALNVEPRQLALTDRPGWVELETPMEADGWENIYLAHVADGHAHPAGRRVRVQATTLDDVLADRAQRVSFVKCDVEGHELPVLHGAEAVTRRDRPVWLLEVNESMDAPDTAAHKVLTWFERRGYKCLVPAGDGWRERTPPEQRVNYLFVPSPP